MVSRLALAFLATGLAVAATACGGSSVQVSGRVTYHDPSQGWRAQVPAGWAAVEVGPEFVRDDPLTDPTRLFLQTYRNRAPEATLHELSAVAGIVVTARHGERAGEALHWQRYAARVVGGKGVAAEVAVAKDGGSADVAALIARRSELEHLVQSTLLPALDSFEPGPPAKPESVLAETPREPSYWPTAGWRTASPASQHMDGDELDALVGEVRDARLPIDSVTVIRNGYVVLDEAFGPFAAGSLREPYATGHLHELQSATKSVTSMLLGAALARRAAGDVTVKTTLVDLAAAADYVPAHIDARKRAITLEDLLTMQSGIAWKESGYAYKPGSGNDVMAMLATTNWTKYTVDRPMATQPGTTFVYNTGGAHLVSAAITLLTRQPAAEVAAKELFGPLGIGTSKWVAAPEGISAGGFGLELEPNDLAKLAFLYLHHGLWDGRRVVPSSWVEQSTTDQVMDPGHEYGYLWWLDRRDGYAYMAGLYGQLAAVVPGKNLVVVITAHIPATADATALTRWLLERYILPAAE